MAQFKPNSDTKVTGARPDAQLEVLVDAANALKVGKHVFELIVADDAGNASEPARVTIIVEDRVRPTAVIDVIPSGGTRVADPSVSIPFGARFVLTGERSKDIGGEIKSYNWTLLAP